MHLVQSGRKKYTKMKKSIECHCFVLLACFFPISIQLYICISQFRIACWLIYKSFKYVIKGTYIRYYYDLFLSITF